MLYLDIEPHDLFNEATNEFISVKATRIQLEHSLVSVAKWESKWHKSFLKHVTELTSEEFISYIECMNMTQNVDPYVFQSMSMENMKRIMQYINDPMSATVINGNIDKNQPESKDDITAELIYYWMINQNIPIEFQKWHLNRLMILIRVCASKNAPKKKMSKQEAAANMRARKAQARARRHR